MIIAALKLGKKPGGRESPSEWGSGSGSDPETLQGRP